MQIYKDQSGFTLVELVVVLTVVAMLMNIAIFKMRDALDRTKSAVAVETARSLHTGILSYYTDMGFYPPDVFRGWDPGLQRRLPYNTDLNLDCETNPADCPVCTHCPANWVDQVRARWRGPYVQVWPQQTPWGGEYDYNPWVIPMNRYGCIVPAGTYLGIQGDYTNNRIIPVAQEQKMIQKNIDFDRCVNGEVQIQIGPSPG